MLKVLENINIKTLPKKSLYVGSAIMIILVLLVIYKKIKSGANSLTSPEQAKNEVKKNNLSYSLANYVTMADTIQAAADHGLLFGTDEDGIYAVFEKLKTRDDLLQLIAAYGKRWYFETWPYRATLANLLYEELDKDEINKVNEILASKGIVFKF